LGAQFHQGQDIRRVQIATAKQRGLAEQGHFQLPFAQLHSQQCRRRARSAQQRVATGLFHLLSGDVPYVKTHAHQDEQR
jgi:hypothetical protein